MTTYAPPELAKDCNKQLGLLHFNWFELEFYYLLIYSFIAFVSRLSLRHYGLKEANRTEEIQNQLKVKSIQ